MYTTDGATDGGTKQPQRELMDLRESHRPLRQPQRKLMTRSLGTLSLVHLNSVVKLVHEQLPTSSFPGSWSG